MTKVFVEHRRIGTVVKNETVGQYFNRSNGKKRRKPLRTIKEMAEEFAISPQSLAALIKHKNGPSAKFRTGGTGTTINTWYDPNELRKWFKEYDDSQV
jgi:hypothetical protein